MTGVSIVILSKSKIMTTVILIISTLAMICQRMKNFANPATAEHKIHRKIRFF